MLLLVAPAQAHEWYSSRVDPVYRNSCCGGHDCAELKIAPGVLEAEDEGYRIRLDAGQVREINPSAVGAVDALVPWSRIQDSEDGKYHICIMDSFRGKPREGVLCFFAPPAM